MINKLTVCVPHKVKDRGHLPAATVEQFERITGIKKTRHWDKSPREIIRQAVLEHKPSQMLDAIILVTQSPDRLSPCMAVDLLPELPGVNPHIPVFDINQSCDGFVYGLWLASRLPGRTLVVCFDQLRFGNQQSTESLIFSDACSVAEVTAAPEEEFTFFNQPGGAQKLYCMVNREMQMDGGAVFDWVTKNIPTFIQCYVEEHREPPEFLCQHQANKSMMKLVDKRAGFIGHSLYSIEEYGNQSMVSIPTALALNEDLILGKRVLLCGYGAGWCAAMANILWLDHKVSRIVEI